MRVDPDETLAELRQLMDNYEPQPSIERADEMCSRLRELDAHLTARPGDLPRAWVPGPTAGRTRARSRRLVPLRTFTTPAGRTFLVRVVPVGAQALRSGWRNEVEPLAEFWDTTYADDGSGPGVYGPFGQFVSSFHVTTLLGTDGYGRGIGPLTLYEGPNWTLDADTMETVREWLRTFDVTPVVCDPMTVLTDNNNNDDDNEGKRT